jgi:hypothetical protein
MLLAVAVVCTGVFHRAIEHLLRTYAVAVLYLAGFR